MLETENKVQRRRLGHFFCVLSLDLMETIGKMRAQVDNQGKPAFAYAKATLMEQQARIYGQMFPLIRVGSHFEYMPDSMMRK